MEIKYFLPALMEFFKSKPSLSDAVSDSASLFRKAVREEIMSVSVRILLASIVSAVIIYALIQVMNQVNLLLLTQIQGEFISIFTFSTVAIIGGLLLMPTLKGLSSDNSIHANSDKKADSPNNLDVNRVLEKFYEGLMKGMDETVENRKEEDPPNNMPEQSFVPKEHSEEKIRKVYVSKTNLTSNNFSGISTNSSTKGDKHAKDM